MPLLHTFPLCASCLAQASSLSRLPWPILTLRPSSGPPPLSVAVRLWLFFPASCHHALLRKPTWSDHTPLTPACSPSALAAVSSKKTSRSFCAFLESCLMPFRAVCPLLSVDPSTMPHNTRPSNTNACHLIFTSDKPTHPTHPYAVGMLLRPIWRASCRCCCALHVLACLPALFTLPAVFALALRLAASCSIFPTIADSKIQSLPKFQNLFLPKKICVPPKQRQTRLSSPKRTPAMTQLVDRLCARWFQVGKKISLIFSPLHRFVAFAFFLPLASPFLTSVQAPWMKLSG